MLKKVKECFADRKKKVALVLSVCTMLSSVAAFAEVTPAPADTAALESISNAMLTSVNGTVAMMITLVVGLVPVALQVLTAFLLFKFGKKFFNQIG